MIGQRLRHLRGEESQASFAARLGLSRAALANYELGRTRPKPSILKSISVKLGISDDFLLSGSFRNEYELNRIFGGPTELSEGVSSDEMAFVQTIRLCPPDIISEIANTILESIENNPPAHYGANHHTLLSDIARLGELRADPQSFGRWEDPAKFAEAVRRQARLSRVGTVPQSVPQSDTD